MHRWNVAIALLISCLAPSSQGTAEEKITADNHNLWINYVGDKSYVALWDEVFFNFGGNVVGNHFDQNRAFLGLGRKLTDTTRLEVGYMEQTIQRRGGEIQDNDHTISVWLMSNASLKHE